ncbi:hypothetical protein [Luteimonas aquatica]|uniref:hypothetical protein n=1 Tax=Luteimonas aquatica TaxID=450364 RepID=UPI001F59790B|nr:hypothetical protein [Luteimonas aquatica]
MKSTTLLVCVALLLLVAFTATASDSLYRYGDPVFPQKNISIDVGNKLFLIADVAEKIELCKEHEEYFCAKSKVFYFSVPNNDEVEVVGKSWVFDGHRYTVDSVDEYSIWGNKKKLSMIREDNKKIGMMYLYSRHYGLIGVGLVDPEKRTYKTFLLEGACGFAASKDCAEVP